MEGVGWSVGFISSGDPARRPHHLTADRGPRLFARSLPVNATTLLIVLPSTMEMIWRATAAMIPLSSSA